MKQKAGGVFQIAYRAALSMFLAARDVSEIAVYKTIQILRETKVNCCDWNLVPFKQ